MRLRNAVPLTLFFALATAACGAAQSSASRDPMKCERDPNCKNRHEKEFDCNTQCADDPACIDRCAQVQQQTGASQPH